MAVMPVVVLGLAAAAVMAWHGYWPFVVVGVLSVLGWLWIARQD